MEMLRSMMVRWSSSDPRRWNDSATEPRVAARSLCPACMGRPSLRACHVQEIGIISFSLTIFLRAEKHCFCCSVDEELAKFWETKLSKCWKEWLHLSNQLLCKTYSLCYYPLLGRWGNLGQMLRNNAMAEGEVVTKRRTVADLPHVWTQRCRPKIKGPSPYAKFRKTHQHWSQNHWNQCMNESRESARDKAKDWLLATLWQYMSLCNFWKSCFLQ